MPDTVEEGAERITYIAAAVNIGLTIVKLIAGVLGSSSALVADAGHSLSDLVSDGVTLWAVRMARIPPDQDHPYGHGRFEAVGALGVGALVMLAGAGLAGEAWVQLRHFLCTCHVAPASPGPIALMAAAVSIVSKELLFRATDEVGKRLNSPVVRANAKHHRSDVGSSVVAVIGVAGSMMGFHYLDPLAAIGVSLMVLRMGLGVTADALGQLTDTADDSVVAAVKRCARDIVGASRVRGARARAMGSHWLVEVEVLPDAFVISASAADHLAARVRAAVLAGVPDATECLVRVHSSTTGCPHVEQLPSPQDIDTRARHALEAVPEVEAVARTVAHFDSAPSVEVWIEVSPERTVSDCCLIAETARHRLLACEPVLSNAEIHLALPFAR